MRGWKDYGLILKLGHFHEADLWLKMLLRNYGIVTVFAFGGAKSKRRFCGCIDLLNTLDCRIHINRTGEYHILEEASLVSGTSVLRSDWKRMGIMANCLKFLDALGIGPDCSRESFGFMQNLKEILEIKQPALCQYFFRLKMAQILGYAPDLAACSDCGISTAFNWRFLADSGKILCQECAKKIGWGEMRFSTMLTYPSLNYLKHILSVYPDAWPAEEMPGETERECRQVIDAFIQYHLGLDWQNGYFMKV